MFPKFKKEKHKHKALFAITVGVAIIAFWRGVWGLFDVYLLPSNYALSCWITIIIGLVILKISHYLYKGLLD